MADFPDPEVGARIKEAADREAAARATRELREAEDRGEIDAKAIVDRMDKFDGKSPPLDVVAAAIAAARGEDEEGEA